MPYNFLLSCLLYLSCHSAHRYLLISVTHLCLWPLFLILCYVSQSDVFSVICRKSILRHSLTVVGHFNCCISVNYISFNFFHCGVSNSVSLKLTLHYIRYSLFWFYICSIIIQLAALHVKVRYTLLTTAFWRYFFISYFSFCYCRIE